MKLTDNSLLLEQAGCAVVNTVAACYLLSCLTFMVGGHIGVWTFPLSVIIAVALQWRKNALKSALIALLTVLVVALPLLVTVDFSGDGNEYRQMTITYLMNGWNPFYDPMPEELTIWGIHYARGTEIVSAAIALMTGHIEAGRAVNAMLIAGTMLMLYPAVRGLGNGVGRMKAAAITLLAGLNPVGVAQLPIYYNDFAKYYLLLISIVLIRKIFLSGEVRSYIMLCTTLILGIGIKFNAAPDLAIAMLFAIILAFVWRRTRLGVNLLLTGVVALLAGTLIFGYNPYVTNTINAGNPLYPLLGAGAEDIMTGNTPDAYLVGNRFSNFFHSICHWPSIARYEIDQKMGGFTFAMPWLLLISVLTFIAARKRVSPVYGVAALVTLLSCFIFEQSWWARYVCQLWLVPVLAAAVLAQIADRRATITLYVTALLGIAGGLASGVPGIFHGSMFRTYRREMFEISRRQGGMRVSESNPVLERHAAEQNLSVTVVPEDSLKADDSFIYYFGHSTVEPKIRVYIPVAERDAMNWVCDW